MLSTLGVGNPALQSISSAGARKRIILATVATAGLSLLIAAATLFWHAYEERHIIAHRGLTAAIGAANAVERQAEAMGYLLKGLSRSPLLQAGDIEGFYHQLQATPRPDGSWFILWDLDRQILNTAHAFGSALPRIDEVPGVRQRLEAVRTIGLSMSDRIHIPAVKRWVVAVSLRLDDPGGRMNRVLTLLVPEEHLNAAIRQAVDTSAWPTIILDRKLQWVSSGLEQSQSPPADELTRVIPRTGSNGHFESRNGPSAILVAFQHSPRTGYTATSLIPATVANAPLLTALYQTSLASILLVVIGATSALILLRNLGPFETLRLAAASNRRELLSTNRRLDAVLESVSDCYFTLDRSYRITDANSATLRWCGRSRDEIIGQHYLDLVAPDTDCVKAVVRAVRHRKPFRGEIPSGLRPDRYLDFRASPSAEGVSIFFSDVTDRYTAHATIIQERELLQASVDALSMRIAILDERGRIIAVNRAWRHFAESIGRRDPDHGVGSDYLGIAATGQGLSEMEAVVAGLRSDFQALYQWPSPEPRQWFTVRASRFKSGDKTRIIVSHEDVTEVMAARATANELADRLLTLQEEERQRIAAELHDSTTQYLVAVGLNLMKVERLLPQRDGQRLLGEIDHLLEEALKELRLFTYLLHPASLDENGLCDTVLAFAEGFSNRTGIQVACRIDKDADRLSIDIRRALLRIVQEALSNTHRHAGATVVRVDLRHVSNEIILCIADNGHGMRSRQAGLNARKASLGVGIPGMRIRLHQFGGSLRIRSGSRGTVVRARMPRGEAAEPDLTTAETRVSGASC